MKKIIITLLLILGLLGSLLAACGKVSQPTQVHPEEQHSPISGGGALKALAVESFLADIAQNVAGDRARVEPLIPLGMDPHAFEPTPQDVIKIAESQVLIVNGFGLEEWLEETIQKVGGERRLIVAAANLTSRPARQDEEALMSPQEKAEQVCADLAEHTIAQQVIAGDTAASAAELPVQEEHDMRLINLRLAPQAEAFSGFVSLDVHQRGDIIIAAPEGTIKILAKDGSQVDVEDTLSLQCSGLAKGWVAELETGDYTLALSGFAANSIPLAVGMPGEHSHDEGNPHFWLDPILVIHYVQNIRDGLIAADPAGEEIYTYNAAAYIEQLKELDNWIRQQVSAIPEARRLIITNHESFGYFADRYGFKIIGTIIPSASTGASPSAQQMARLVDTIKTTGATALFLETGSNPQLAEQISRETGVKVVSELYTHSLSTPDGKAPTYIEMMKYNVLTIVEALRSSSSLPGP